ncbi:MAG TPA: hypothetical protein VMD76_13360 [Candidatus Sulfotelmatobacter sp.]|nr:hypothetical protein [Candidatus Sulfotelmatobacter sp.]
MPENTQTEKANLDLFRHTLSTLAYRAGKALRGVPAEFSDFHAAAGVRAPVEILAHLGDLLDWALSMAKGAQKWQDSNPLPWDQEVNRFFAALKKFDDFLASGATVHAPLDKLFQAPIADALTHVGQISMLRRLAATPVKAENFYVAEIVVGRVGTDQSKPKREF